MEQKEKILYSSEKAAKRVTGLSGWVDGDGRFWGENEHMARWSGCTHVICESCGNEVRKQSYCEPCHQKKRDDKFEAYELIAWDREQPFAIFDSEEYFFDLGSFSDYVLEHELDLDDIQLVVCTPNYVKAVDEDYWEEYMPEGGDLPNEVQEALANLNQVIGRNKHILSWSQGDKRLDAKQVLF